MGEKMVLEEMISGKNVPSDLKYIHKVKVSQEIAKLKEMKNFHRAVKLLFTASIKNRPCSLKQKRLRCIKKTSTIDYFLKWP